MVYRYMPVCVRIKKKLPTMLLPPGQSFGCRWCSDSDGYCHRQYLPQRVDHDSHLQLLPQEEYTHSFRGTQHTGGTADSGTGNCTSGAATPGPDCAVGDSRAESGCPSCCLLMHAPHVVLATYQCLLLSKRLEPKYNLYAVSRQPLCDGAGHAKILPVCFLSPSSKASYCQVLAGV